MTVGTTVAGIDTDKNNQLKVAAEAAVAEIRMAMATAMTTTTAMMTAAIFTPTTTTVEDGA